MIGDYDPSHCSLYKGERKFMNGRKYKSKGISKYLWIFLSLVIAILFWTLLSVLPQTARSFPNVII